MTTLQETPVLITPNNTPATVFARANATFAWVKTPDNTKTTVYIGRLRIPPKVEPKAVAPTLRSIKAPKRIKFADTLYTDANTPPSKRNMSPRAKLIGWQNGKRRDTWKRLKANNPKLHDWLQSGLKHKYRLPGRNFKRWEREALAAVNMQRRADEAREAVKRLQEAQTKT